MKQCVGCGAYLQTEDPKAIGYVQDLNMDYCQRCFKMIHYDQHESLDFVADNEQILEQLAQLKGHYCWIIDVFDFDTSLNCSLAEFFKEKECSVILNKCDLLPRNVNLEHFSNYVIKRLHSHQIKVKTVLTRGLNPDFCECFDQQMDLSQPIILCGLSNVGKSTIINHLLKETRLTVNRYPATTININEIRTEKYHLYDTVGVIAPQSIQPYLENAQLKLCMLTRPVKPISYQVYEDQSFALGGLVRLDITQTHKGTVIFYNSPLLKIHRGKKSNAERYWQNHYNEELTPVIGKSADDLKHLHFIHKGKAEYFIAGLGFIQVNSPACELDLYVYKNIQINKREAML